jgi:hypothetical protein
LETPGETKVTDFELAVGVDEEVSRFEIAVEDVGRVDVLGEVSGGQGSKRTCGQAVRWVESRMERRDPLAHLQTAESLVEE